MARIALDAMGGDLAPRATIAGELLALQELGPEHTIQLVGRSDIVRAELDTLLAGEFSSLGGASSRLSIVEAPDVIEMTDKPSVAIRGKPQSSMAVGLRLQAEGQSDAFVSAGNTGAQMAASTFILRLHEGLTRPAIGTLIPTARVPLVMLDAGANVDCSAAELVSFARLGAVYAEDVLGRPNPSVALLSVGEEPEKGNAVVKEAHQLLAATAGLNFHGNVEGRDIPMGASDRGPVDVVVCDGFVGNVVLKFYEGVAPMLMGLLLKGGVDKAQLAGALKHLDYAQHGGAPLLGVKGVSIICHGKSSPEAIKNGIKVALRAVESHMSDHIGRSLSATGEGTSA
ncbi:MAG: phosphate acyltransferase PlsX [Gemmatimonadaceae bacterium]